MAIDVAGLAGVARPRRASVIPGFGLTMGLTLAWLGLVVPIPLTTIFLRAAGLGWEGFVAVGLSPRALAAYRLSFGAAAAAAAINAMFGLLIAWILVRYDFPGKRLVGLAPLKWRGICSA